MRHPVAEQASSSISPFTRPANVLALTVFLTAALLALLMLTGARAFGESQPHVARLSNVDGTVQILKGNQTEFDQAVANMPLVEGSRVQTGSNGRAEVQFDNGSIARLTPNSSMTLVQIQRGLEGAQDTQIELLSGMGYFQLRSRGGEDSVVFGTNTVTPVDGPATLRVSLDATPTELSVLDGKVHVAGGTQFAVDVQTNETIRFDASDSTRYYLAQGVAADSWDQWNNDRDQDLSQQAVKQSEVAAKASGMGWSDLDQNGNWYSVPGYGNVWSPYGAGMGWDPYGNGYWASGYGAGGYTWISGYPWGWLPYQCGGWNYFNSFGWGWMPTNCGYGGGGGYYPGGPVIINGPPGYHPPPRPRPAEVVATNGNGTPTRIVKVNNGARLTPLQNNLALAPRPIVVNGTVVHPMPLKTNPQAPIVHSTALRPTAPVQTMQPVQSQAATTLQHPVNTGARAPYTAPVVAPGGTQSFNSLHNNSSPNQAYVPMAPSAPRAIAPPAQPHYSAPPPQPHYSAPVSQPHYSSPSYSSPSYSAPRSAPASAPAPAPAQTGRSK